MRVILRLAGAILVLAVLGVVGVLMIPAERVAEAAARQFRELTGRQLQIDGSVRPSFWPDLGVRTGPVSIANADWSEAGPMLQADGLQIGVNLAGLLGGEVQVTGLQAIGPRLILERASDGRENWVFGGQNGGSVTAGTPGVDAPFSFDRLEVKGGTFIFIDHAADQRWTVDALDLRASSPAWDGPATLTATGQANGQAVSLTGTAGVFSDLVNGRVAPVTMDVVLGEARLEFDGRAGFAPLQAEGQVQADLGDLSALSALVGTTLPARPKGLGADTVALSGAMTLAADGRLFLRTAEVMLDGNRFAGAADLALDGARPKLTAQLAAGALSFGAGATAAGGQDGASDQPVAKGWSTAPIDVSGLAMMDADIAVSFASLAAPLVNLGASRLRLTLDRARAVAEVIEMQAYGGAVSGRFVVNGRGGLSLRSDLTFAGLAMKPLLTDVAGYDRLSGTGDATIRVLGVGDTQDALMRSLEGDGELALSKGELRGLDVLGMLRSLDAGYVGEGQKTIFDALTATFTLAGGALDNDDLSLTGPYLVATGAGQVGVGARNLDYRLRPTALAEADGSGGVMVPLVITGTWDNPKFRLDLESIARERMEQEARALEDKAKARAKELEAEAKAELETRLQDELGVEMRDGESLEDAARRRAEEALDAEAERLLRDLLGNEEAPVAGE